MIYGVFYQTYRIFRKYQIEFQKFRWHPVRNNDHFVGCLYHLTKTMMILLQNIYRRNEKTTLLWNQGANRRLIFLACYLSWLIWPKRKNVTEVKVLLTKKSSSYRLRSVLATKQQVRKELIIRIHLTIFLTNLLTCKTLMILSIKLQRWKTKWHL